MVLRIHFDYLQSTAKLIHRYYFPQRKQHVLWFRRKGESSFGSVFRNVPMAKFEIVFLSIFLHFSRVKFIIILSISLKFPVGQSRKCWLTSWLTFSISFLIVSVKMYFCRMNRKYRKFAVVTKKLRTSTMKNYFIQNHFNPNAKLIFTWTDIKFCQKHFFVELQTVTR